MDNPNRPDRAGGSSGRPSSFRPGGFSSGGGPRRGSRPMRGSRPRSGGGGPRGRGGPRGKAAELPVLMGEPSPSLAKINKMSLSKLSEKIDQLKVELARVNAKLERMNAQDEKPADRIARATELVARLKALLELAEQRKVEKAERAAAYEARQQRG